MFDDLQKDDIGENRRMSIHIELSGLTVDDGLKIMQQLPHVPGLCYHTIQMHTRQHAGADASRIED
jgi:hypothetical protein